MKITRQENVSSVVLRIEGEITLFQMDSIRGEFFSLLQGDRKPVLLDLHLVTRIDSTGIGQLVDFQNRLKGQERRLYLCDINRTVREIMELGNVTALFSLRDSVEQALES